MAKTATQRLSVNPHPLVDWKYLQGHKPVSTCAVTDFKEKESEWKRSNVYCDFQFKLPAVLKLESVKFIHFFFIFKNLIGL